jgi:hypothetical protein
VKPSTRPARLAAELCAALAIAFSGAWVLGQYAKPVQSSAVGQVNPQVNTALYGGGVPASVRYSGVGSTSVAMGSEVRYAAWSSGALPSDVRMGYANLGPMHPAGPLAYIPPPAPSYTPKPQTAPPPAIGGAAYTNASIRYSAPTGAAGSTYVAPRSVAPAPVASPLVSPGPINSGPINSGPINGSVRYGR